MTLLEETVYEAERFIKVAKQKPPKYSTIRRASQDLSQKLVDLRTHLFLIGKTNPD